MKFEVIHWANKAPARVVITGARSAEQAELLALEQRIRTGEAHTVHPVGYLEILKWEEECRQAGCGSLDGRD